MKKSQISRRQFLVGGAATLVGVFALGGCSSTDGPSTGGSPTGGSSTGGGVEGGKIVFVWEPNESTATYEGMRNEFAACIEKGGGLECEIMTTTDYNVTIESLISGKAHMASLGASEYIEAHAKNPAVNIAFVLSNDEGKLDEVSYRSQICVRTEDVEQYKSGASYSLENIKGKNFSFVNLNSTSGFVVPSTVIKNTFGLASTDEVSESGSFFDTVLFPGSHPGSLYNLLSKEADAAVFADYLVAPFVELVSGEAGTAGAVYQVKEGVDTPLDTLGGAQFTIIESLPVPAVPICINTDAVPEDVREAIIDYMCSEEVANNPKIFPAPDDTETVSNWSKATSKVCFVRADDNYYDPFREMIGFEH
ncbi:MAG: phosphate/phosphite/phosphonate ABC transporter substrate-binding protein [Coriobacteriales bacterium]|jgi:phosphonate transport system substrate-binding protein|nr:phosphate/phosphite/phosphonate ABC transporter substrate-binding protein [Coriobacteriales bacterium]